MCEFRVVGLLVMLKRFSVVSVSLLELVGSNTDVRFYFTTSFVKPPGAF